MDGIGANAAARKLFGDAIWPVLGAREHKGARIGAIAQQGRKQCALVIPAAGDPVQAIIDRVAAMYEAKLARVIPLR